ncbi:hypothetical protein NXC14_PA00536 (plasmid) [Rhizobium sp. NXC14]|nr:hypothetical protein NXC14_PA00536 [Rhizobium sp. NXC14]
MPLGDSGLKDERYPPIFSRRLEATSENRLPHSPALPVACAIPDPAIPSRPLSSSFTKSGDQTMTYTLEIQIEELRAELRNACDAAERRKIEAELELAQADLAVTLAEQDGAIVAEPPF